MFLTSSIAALATTQSAQRAGGWFAAPKSGYRIERIELYVRVTPVGRLAVSLGKNTGQAARPERNPLAHVRMIVRDAGGRQTFGCSGDRMSVRWLDKRPGREKPQKLRDLVALIEHARDVYLARPSFEQPFDQWNACYPKIQRAGRAAQQEDLTSSYAAALMERAMLDAVCRLNEKSLFEMAADDRLGFAPGDVHAELTGMMPADYLPKQPVTRFHVRHTIGKADPLTDDDLPRAQRLNDGLPETLTEYVRINGHTRFKIKISGDAQFDLKRLARIWEVLPDEPGTRVTLDANEAYPDLERFAGFVIRLRRDVPGLFEHLAYIEQPLPRGLTLDAKTAPAIRRIAALRPLLIDEADGTVKAFSRALAIGYTGVSHKNCKGFFKSLANRALVVQRSRRGERLFQSGEDLQNLPVVPLQQDFAALSVLDIDDCERNGHHFNFGLSLLTPGEKAAAEAHHADLYVRRGDALFVNIQKGMVHCSSLQCPGFGLRDQPDWDSMLPMRIWLRQSAGG